MRELNVNTLSHSVHLAFRFNCALNCSCCQHCSNSSAKFIDVSHSLVTRSCGTVCTFDDCDDSILSYLVVLISNVSPDNEMMFGIDTHSPTNVH